MLKYSCTNQAECQLQLHDVHEESWSSWGGESLKKLKFSWSWKKETKILADSYWVEDDDELKTGFMCWEGDKEKFNSEKSIYVKSRGSKEKRYLSNLKKIKRFKRKDNCVIKTLWSG